MKPFCSNSEDPASKEPLLGGTTTASVVGPMSLFAVRSGGGARATPEDVRQFQRFAFSRWVVLPNSWWAEKFDVLLLACLFYTASVTVLQVCVRPIQPNASYEHGSYESIMGMFLLGLAVDFVFMLDTVLKCFRSCVIHGRLEFEPSVIARHYIGTIHFYFDVVAALPLEAPDLYIHLHPELSYARNTVIACRLIRFLQLLRLVRGFKVWQTSSLALFIKRNSSTARVACFSLPAMFGFVLHWLSCLLLFLANVEEGDDWIDLFASGQARAVWARRVPCVLVVRAQRPLRYSTGHACTRCARNNTLTDHAVAPRRSNKKTPAPHHTELAFKRG